MVGITSYGAYVPLFRLGTETKGWGRPGEKAVANFDEDSLTMAVAAAIDCLNGIDRKTIDGLFFATTTSPYKEKQAAAAVATATDLRRDIITMDSTDSLRAGTTAMMRAIDSIKAGSAKKVLVTVADCRIGAPQSDVEQNSGDGAAALLFGDSEVAVSVEGSYSVSNELLDQWRGDSDTFVRAWEDRFILEEGYLKVLPEAVSGLMKKYSLAPKDFTKAVFYSPDARRHREMARMLGFSDAQVPDPLFGKIGNTGAAFAPMLLVAALEEAKAGDKILLANYGDGADAHILQVTDNIEKIRGRRGIKGHLKRKIIVSDYDTYLRWRGLLSAESASRRPPMPMPSVSALRREQDQILRLYGAKCKTCGTVQYPPQRVCTRCHTKDNFESVRLSDKKGELFTYAMDYIAGTMDIPLVICIVNMEGGGRILNTMTDRDISEVRIGMPLEMSFRQLHYAGGVHNYFWKCIPPKG